MSEQPSTRPRHAPPVGPRELSGRTVLMSGGSRGIGHAIAVALAAQGANLVLLAKTDAPHATLPGTVHSAVADVEAAGGRGLAVVGDLRSDEDVDRAVAAAVEAFGGVDVVVNNASAIDLSPTESLSMKRWDLMHDINVRGTFRLSQAAMPHLRASAREAAAAGAETGSSWRPQILTLSPPLTDAQGRLEPEWFGRHLGYTMAKYGMSMMTLGLSRELADDGVLVNSLWPATLIDTAAVRAMPGGEELIRSARRPQIVADAARAVLTGAVGEPRGEFLIDEQVLESSGVADLRGYAVEEGRELIGDAFLPAALDA